jgi:hypothetical protein
MFQNMRSNILRRNAGGGIVDEAAPSGLDALRNIPHSWEQEYNNAGTIYGRTGSNEPTPANAITQRGADVTAMIGPKGGGFSTPFKSVTDGLEPVSTYGDEMPGIEGKLRVSGPSQAALGRNVTSMYNRALQQPYTPFAPEAQKVLSGLEAQQPQVETESNNYLRQIVPSSSSMGAPNSPTVAPPAPVPQPQQPTQEAPTPFTQQDWRKESPLYRQNGTSPTPQGGGPIDPYLAMKMLADFYMKNFAY